MLLKSETIKNLVNAFAGESQARNRYSFYAKAAKKEGYLQIAKIFEETAHNEHQHAKIFYKFIPPEHYKVCAEFPFFLGKTYDNLIAASDAEHEEWTVIYRHAADTAKAEGFNDISKAFSLIVDVEKYHQNRFLELAKHVKEKQVFSREYETQWICNKCGYHTISKAAPLNCPLCNHDYSHFQLLCDKY